MYVHTDSNMQLGLKEFIYDWSVIFCDGFIVWIMSFILRQFLQ